MKKYYVFGTRDEEPDYLRLIMKGEIEGRRSIGRRRISWFRNLIEWLGMSFSHLLRAIANKVKSRFPTSVRKRHFQLLTSWPTFTWREALIVRKKITAFCGLTGVYTNCNIVWDMSRGWLRYNEKTTEVYRLNRTTGPDWIGGLGRNCASKDFSFCYWSKTPTSQPAEKLSNFLSKRRWGMNPT